jgi:hypothetical protein
MTNIDSSTMQDAELEAQRVSVTEWFWIGLLLGAIGVLIVYLRSPKASVTLLVKYEEDERWMFERSYAETLKAREVKNTWIGLAACLVLSLSLSVLFFFLAFTVLNTL